jgi:hypothetical protein
MIRGAEIILMQHHLDDKGNSNMTLKLLHHMDEIHIPADIF